MRDSNETRFRALAYELRRRILQSVYHGGGGHIGGAFSIIDALVVLYQSVLRHDVTRPDDPDRDRLLFSKGHSCLALYHALGHQGFFDPTLLETYGKDGASVAGHPELGRLPGIEISSGSLGHGPAIGVGVALAGRLSGRNYRTFVIVGDGECNEGAVWEAMMAASQLRLGRFCLIVDNNGMESLGPTQDIIGLAPLAAKLQSFGAEVEEIDGHNFSALLSAFALTDRPTDRPRAVVLNTNKGHGVDFMSNVAKWHYRAPNEGEYSAALQQLETMINA